MYSESLPSIDAPIFERSCPTTSVAPLATVRPLSTRIREALRRVAQMFRRQYFIHVWQMQIGKGSIVSFGARLDKRNPRGIHIGKDSVVTFGASVLTRDALHTCDRDVYIGDCCFIGAHATVMPGVTIGDHCIVAAASVVARDVPAGSLVAGNPARVVERNIKTGRCGVRVANRHDLRKSS